MVIKIFEHLVVKFLNQDDYINDFDWKEMQIKFCECVSFFDMSWKVRWKTSFAQDYRGEGKS